MACKEGAGKINYYPDYSPDQGESGIPSFACCPDETYCAYRDTCIKTAQQVKGVFCDGGKWIITEERRDEIKRGSSCGDFNNKNFIDKTDNSYLCLDNKWVKCSQGNMDQSLPKYVVTDTEYYCTYNNGDYNWFEYSSVNFCPENYFKVTTNKKSGCCPEKDACFNFEGAGCSGSNHIHGETLCFNSEYWYCNKADKTHNKNTGVSLGNFLCHEAGWEKKEIMTEPHDKKGSFIYSFGSSGIVFQENSLIEGNCDGQCAYIREGVFECHAPGFTEHWGCIEDPNDPSRFSWITCDSKELLEYNSIPGTCCSDYEWKKCEFKETTIDPITFEELKDIDCTLFPKSCNEYNGKRFACGYDRHVGAKINNLCCSRTNNNGFLEYSWEQACYDAYDSDQDGIPQSDDICQFSDGGIVDDFNLETKGCSCLDIKKIILPLGYTNGFIELCSQKTICEGSFCDTCFNGFLDYQLGEIDIDCGGNCEVSCGGYCKKIKDGNSKYGLAFMASGYQNEELGEFFKDVKSQSEGLENYVPFRRNIDSFVVTKFYPYDFYFFDSEKELAEKEKRNPDYWPYVHSEGGFLLNYLVREALAMHCPSESSATIIKRYQGSGGTGGKHIGIFLIDFRQGSLSHELGHNLGLGDEYYDEVNNDHGQLSSPGVKNCDIDKCPKWISLSDKSAFGSEPTLCENGCLYGNKLFRPSLNSLMNNELSSKGSFNLPSMCSICNQLINFKENGKPIEFCETVPLGYQNEVPILSLCSEYLYNIGLS